MIRWITEDIGTAAYMSIVNDSNKDYKIVDVRNLVDKVGNDVSEIGKKISEAVDILKTGTKVVICCDYGMSRSNSIAAGVIHLHNGVSVFDAIRLVIAKTGENEIKLPMLNTVIKWSGYNIDSSEKGVLVTGSGGFIGKELLKFADSSWITPSSKELNLITDSVKLNLLIKEKHIKTLVHLANPKINTTYGAFGNALSMLKVVLDACLENHVRFICLSSWVIYEGYRGEMQVDESVALSSKTNYGDMRVLAETLIQMYIKRGLKCTIIRSPSVYGLGKDVPKFIWNFIDKAKRNETINVHHYLNGNPRIDLIHVSDVAGALKLAITNDLCGFFNIGGNSFKSTKEIAELIVRMTCSESNVEETRINDYVASIKMDYSCFGTTFNWSPKIELEDGLKELITHSYSNN